MRVTTLGPALMTVTGTTRLFSSNTCVMPSLVPRMPFRAISKGLLLDSNIDAGRQIDAHQGVNGLGRRIEDVDQSLVCTHLEVLPRVLVLMRGPDDAVDVLLSRQRHWANHAGAGTGDRLHDLARRGVNRLVVVGLEPDADLLSRHASPTSLLRLGPAGKSQSGRPFRRTSRWYAAAVHLSMVHRSPRSGVSPLRTFGRGGKSSRSRWGPDAPVRALAYAPRQAAQKRRRPGSRQPEQYALDPGPPPNLWPRETRSVLTPE